MPNILFIKANNPSWRNQQAVYPLGVMHLSSFLKKHRKDCHIRIIDTKIKKFSEAALMAEIKAFAPAIIGISAIRNESVSAHRIAAAAKNAAPSAKIVIGGPYATTAPELALSDANIDCAVLGEGEETFLELAGVLERGGGDLEKVKGLAFMENGALTRTPPRELIEDLDTLPFPDWDAVDIKAYPGYKRMSILNNDGWMLLFTSRGCPYECVYCHNIFGKRFRARSAEKVIEEIDILHTKYGIGEFDIIDDIFNYDRERAARICDYIIGRGYGLSLSFPNGLRLDRLDCGLLDKLKAAGTKAVSFPIETLVPRLQKVAGKNLDTSGLKKLIEHALRLEMFSTGLFMIGFPTETEAETELTIKFAIDSGFHAAEFFTVTPFQGTRLWEMLSKSERDNGPDYTGHNFFRRDINPRLIFLQRMAYLRFYISPRRMTRIIAAYLRISPLRGLIFRFLNVVKRIF
jgi:radical SAM superfamily enzyme YgiQ (UPF0313 family)